MEQVGVICFYVIVIGTVLGLYLNNIRKLIIGLRNNEYNIRLFIRGIGIFFPLIGIIMGFV